MRIVSKFHDYYDKARLGSSDPTKVYVRQPVEVTEMEAIRALGDEGFVPHDLTFSMYQGIAGYLDEEGAMVLFCGKLYPVVILGDLRRVRHACYDLESLLRLERQNGYMRPGGRETTYHSTPLGLARRFFARRGEETNFNLRHRAPVTTWHRVLREQVTVTLNGPLYPFQFQKVLDPYTALQEIEMFVGGVLAAPEKEMPKLSDDLMRQKSGFDERSFKREAHPRKSRRELQRGDR